MIDLPRSCALRLGSFLESEWNGAFCYRENSMSQRPRDKYVAYACNRPAEHNRRIAESKHKPVIQLDTGVVFASISEAAAAIGAPMKSLSSAIVRGHKCRGFRWAKANGATYHQATLPLSFPKPERSASNGAARKIDHHRRWLIYAIEDPRVDSYASVRYVGKSHVGDARFRQHLSHAAKGYPLPSSRGIRKMVDAGCNPRFRVLEEGIGDGWQAAEKRWIAFYRAHGCSLWNLTDGGDGLPGAVHSEETRRRMSAGIKAYYRANPVIASPNCKPVRQVETQKVFASGAQAASHIGRTPSAICAAIAKNRPCAGFHWEYA